MSVVQTAKVPAVFDLRSAALTLIVVALKTNDLAALETELTARFGTASEMFEGDPVAIDLAQVSATEEDVDFLALTALLRRYGMVPVAARGGTADQMIAARAAGLAAVPPAVARPASKDAAEEPPPVEKVEEEPAPPALAAVTI